MRQLYQRFAKGMALGASEFAAAVGRDEIARRFGEPFDQRSLAAQFPATAYAFREPGS